MNGPRRGSGNFSGQGGPPRVGLPGTVSTPVAQSTPGQVVSPESFVGSGQLVETNRLPSPQLDARGIPTGGPGLPVAARLDSYFFTRLPEQGMYPWHRVKTVAGSTAFSAINTVYDSVVQKLPQGTSAVIMQVVQYWLEAGLDPLDVNALEAYPDYQNAYGRVSTNLLFNRTVVFNAEEELYDPAGVTNKVSGFTMLNQNILNIGPHPTAIYVPDGASISIRWITGPVLPAHIPSAVGVRLDGYTLPTKTLNNIMRSVRSGM